jgi:hypothetical protein
MMAQTEHVLSKARDALSKHGPMDFLHLADMIAPECKIGLREVERILRVLLGQRRLVTDDKSRVMFGGEKEERNRNCSIEQEGAQKVKELGGVMTGQVGDSKSIVVEEIVRTVYLPISVDQELISECVKLRLTTSELISECLRMVFAEHKDDLRRWIAVSRYPQV